MSSCPGTRVELSRGRARTGGREFEIIDTQGMHSFFPTTGRGMDELKRRTTGWVKNVQSHRIVEYEKCLKHSIEKAVGGTEVSLKQDYRMQERTIGLLLLKDDRVIKELTKESDTDIVQRRENISEEVKPGYRGRGGIDGQDHGGLSF